MKLSRWIRLWIVAGALTATACEDPELQQLRREHQEQRDQALVDKPAREERDRLVRLEMACKQFVAETPIWRRAPLAEGTPDMVRADMAIRQMLEACEKSSPDTP